MYNNYNYIAKGQFLMFGYVKTDKGELRVKEYELYKGLYCSLCKALGKRYGVFSRLILSYDMTFLLLIKLCEKGIAPSFKKGRCPFNPAKKCSYCQNGEEVFDFVCAAAVLMFYYKVKDNIADSRIFKKLLFLLLLPIAALWRKKAARLFPQLEEIICNGIKKQRREEEENTCLPDRAAHPSADTLGKIFSLDAAKNAAALYRFGYFVGRWVYLLDALDDIESDLKSGSFNVFVNKYSLFSKDLPAPVRHEIESTLNSSSGEALSAFKSCKFEISSEIIENILTGGMYRSAERVLKGNKKNERSL